MQNPAAFDDYEPYGDDQALSDSARFSNLASNNNQAPLPFQHPASSLSHRHSMSLSRPSSSLSRSSRPPSSLSAHLNGPGSKPYRRLTPTPSQRNSPSLPFPPLAQPSRSTPSSELSGSNPYSPSPDSSEYSNPYSSSQLVPPTSSYDTAHRAIAGSHRRAGSQGQEDMSHMPVEDLLWIPSIIKMYNDYNHLKDQCLDLSSSISSSIKTQTKMYEEASLLRWQLDQARSGAAPPLNRNRPDSRPAALPDTQAAASTFGNSSQRPEEYPVSILWTFADAKKDRTVGTTLTNPNRLSLGQIIRHPDGSVIDESTYAMVRSSARNVAMTLLLPLVNKRQELKGKTGKNSPGTKSFFRTFFHNEWIDAILQLEELQPLLTYCAGHWKAEAVLQNMLDSLRTKEGNDRVDDIDDADDMYNADVEQGGQNQSKRPYMPSMDSTHRSPKCNKTMAAVDLTSSKPNSRRVKTFMPTLAPKGKPTHAAARTSRQGSLLTTTAKNMGMVSTESGIDTGMGPTNMGADVYGDEAVGRADDMGGRADEMGGRADEMVHRADEMGGHADEIDPRADEMNGHTDEIDARADETHASRADEKADETDPCANGANDDGDVAFIKVNPTSENLQWILNKRYPTYTAAAELLRSMDLNPTFSTGTAPEPESVNYFIENIESANPHSLAYEEDDLGACWGHHQFQGWRQKLGNDWVGSENAQRLIAGVLKTCIVARNLCHTIEMDAKRKGQKFSYLSDTYLEQITEHLWELWKAAGGPIDKGKTRALQPSPPGPSATPAEPLPATTSTVEAIATPEELAAALSTWDVEKMKALSKDELIRLISTYKLASSTSRQKTKEKLAEIIVASLNSSASPPPNGELLQDLYHLFKVQAVAAPRSKRGPRKTLKA
ncbi:hypothetical protein M378DRAFT_11249 [Amanita muscaria Koide BX008]|uniref:Uncharacterized protein n=1 Tax=Amanita muscaria (strain Koide BX008) TaxID=946122 RepID=A0A0C2X7E4_AMAMK|nr:hypothetical protein M378DRAFT_11249 [Amanita muscaria Koide BX008]